MPAVAFDRASRRSGAFGAAAALLCLAILLSATMKCGGAEAPPPVSDGSGEPEADEATIEALRSLGYLASGHGKSASPETGEIPFRIVLLAAMPVAGSRHRVVRSLAEWSALFSDGDVPALGADFESEMAVVMPVALEGDAPFRQEVVSVVMTADAVRIECRSEPLGERDDVNAGRQVVLIPATGLPVHVVTR